MEFPKIFTLEVKKELLKHFGYFLIVTIGLYLISTSKISKTLKVIRYVSLKIFETVASESPHKYFRYNSSLKVLGIDQ